MGGLLSDAMRQVVPTCKYGHGELAQVTTPGGGRQFMSPEAHTMTGHVWGSSVSISPNAFAYAVFKCMTCSYVELHDLGD